MPLLLDRFALFYPMRIVGTAFMVVVLGGVGQLIGAVMAAFSIGGLNTFLEWGTSASLGKVLVFVIIIAFLQWRPSGMVARRAR